MGYNNATQLILSANYLQGETKQSNQTSAAVSLYFVSV